MYENVLNFNGKWRTYQQRVLNHFDLYKNDKKVHIVAAPGSGKTTLGIELIKRFDKPVLIFAPTITIREQWVQRIEEAFFNQELKSAEYISQDLKHLKLINVTTYQSLYSAMTRYQGIVVEGEDDQRKEELVDYLDYNLLEEVQKAHIETICLDECHHLRSEWWKALEDFKKKSNIIYTISLTATPPYDSSPQMWNRYIELCGEIDEEITVPELVKEGSLCPHQDYVYFNYPTFEEEKEIKKFKQRSHEILLLLMEDSRFCRVVQSHRCLYQQIDLDQILENPAYLSSILIFLEDKGLSYPSYYQNILGYKKLEKMNEKWMEILLQGLLYDDTDSFVVEKAYYDEIMNELKSRGLIEKRKVTLSVNQAIEKMLVKSVGKCESIKTIVFHEYEIMKNELKLLILTDFIKKDYEKNIGNLNKNVNDLGVLPFFEMLRRESKVKNDSLKIGVLCGTMMIIPAHAKERLLELCEQKERIVFQKIGQLSENEYVEVKVTGTAHFMVGLISQLFEEGYMHVLIGTKSLLGEGWDSPCVNTLILASFVGSFMLSNQMRGRAIRTYKNNPHKASHIWHLVCLNPEEQVIQNSEDFKTLSRRMDHFLGLHYEEDTIESGMLRLSAIHYPLTKMNVSKTNKDMLKQSSKRHHLKERWNHSLAVIEKIDVVEENAINEHLISLVLFHDAIRKYIVLTFCYVLAIIIGLPLLPGGFLNYLFFVFTIASYILLAALCIQKIFNYKNPLARLKIFGQGILRALLEMNLLKSTDCCVKTDSSAMNHIIYLAGGSGYDKDLFSKCVLQFFGELDNQRYILYNPHKKKKSDGYFVVPDVFAKRKEDAHMFAEYMKPYIGKYEVIYTRNKEGRKILLEGRIYALANKEERCFTKKKVKGALE